MKTRLLMSIAAMLLVLPAAQAGPASGPPPATKPSAPPPTQTYPRQQQDQDRLQRQDQDRIHSQDRERIYGYQLMTEAERNEFRERLRNAKTDQERAQIQAEHRRLIQDRAQERGVPIPEDNGGSR